MPRNHQTQITLVVGLAAASIALVGCSAQGPDSAQTPAPAVSTSAPSATTSASSTPSPSASPSKPTTTSKDLSPVKVTGAVGEVPTVTAPWPWAIEKTTVKVLKAGTGPTVADAGQIEVNYIGINGRTGQPFDSSFDTGQTATFNVDQVIPGFKTGLVGQKVGSRVVIGIPSKDGYGTEGNSQAGIQGTDTLVFVVDIVSTSLTKPTGTAVTPKPGLPTVVDKDGVPQITVPGGDAPKDLVVQPLIKGTGKKVTATDAITVHYKAVDYATGKEIVSSYGSQPQSGLLSDVIEGWKKGLVDQTVGSRVMLIVPPDQGYPQGNKEPSIAPGQTLVYVVDILFTQSAPVGQ